MAWPPLAESEDYIAGQGWSIERIALVCADVQAAYDDLVAASVASAWEPEPFVVDGVTLAIAAGVWSPEGLMIDLVQHVDVAVPRPVRGDRGDLALHHVCCLTPDLATAEEFWTTHFGLTKTYDFTAPMDCGGAKGFIMLSDPFFDAGAHEFSLEIIGGEFDSIDGPVFERRGSCYDHVRTLPPEFMTDAHRAGGCSNHWVDDWQRNPKVLPRKGGLPVNVSRP